MKRVRPLLVLVALATLSAWRPVLGQRPAPAALVEAARTIGDELAAVRQLGWRGPVDFQVSDRETIRGFATESLERQMPPEEWRAQTALLQHCGLLPSGVDLKDLVVRLYTEQVAGYYDPQRKTFYLADWLPQLLQKAVVAHEVTHALQDQHFDLTAWLDAADPSDDEALARAAVTEGDAMAAMLAYLLQPVGVDVSRLPDPAELLSSQSDAIGQAYPTFDEAPHALKRMLLFPYVEGTSFVLVALRARGWSAVDELYADPPQSTEQILHPERYWERRDAPSEPAEPTAPSDAEVPATGSWGEFGTALILEAALGDSATVGAAGWDGDRYVLARRPNGELAYGWSLVWDSPEEATRFARAYAQAIVRRFPRSARITTGEGRFHFDAPARRLAMTWHENEVRIEENY